MKENKEDQLIKKLINIIKKEKNINMDRDKIKKILEQITVNDITDIKVNEDEIEVTEILTIEELVNIIVLRLDLNEKL